MIIMWHLSWYLNCGIQYLLMFTSWEDPTALNAHDISIALAKYINGTSIDYSYYP